MKKTAKKETRHLVGSADAKITVCGRPIGKVLLWAKKNPPKADDATVCGRCRKLAAGRAVKAAEEKKNKPIVDDIMKNADKRDPAKIPGKRTPALAILGDRMPRTLEVLFKGKTYQADVIQDEGVATGAVRGTIRIDGQLFNSPSRAGKHVAGREVDGWTFWSYANKEGGLEKLDALRKAVA